MQKTLPEGMKLRDHLQCQDIDNIKTDFKLIVFEVVDWFHLALDRVYWRSSIDSKVFLVYQGKCQLLRSGSAMCYTELGRYGSWINVVTGR